MKIIIDPGHGGKDPGGGSNYLWTEKNKVLEISLYQYNRLKKIGVDVELTRDKDIYIDPTERTRRVRESKATICISNHINAFNGLASGAETIHSIYSDGKLANMILDALVDAGATRRRVFFKESEKQKGKDYYFMHRDTGQVQTVIIEYGFGDNSEDIEKIDKDWQKYAEAVVRALCMYIGVEYNPPATKKEDKYSPWAIDAMNWAIGLGLTDGTNPKDPISLERFITVLYRYDRARG